MTDVAVRFDALTSSLDRLGSPIGQFLRPGSSDDAIRAALGSVGLDPPAELLDWFGRHDGPDEDAYQRADAGASPLELFPGVRPLTLEQAASDCIAMRTSVEDLGEDADRFWRAPWFPLLVGPGSVFAIDCSTGDQDEAPVWRSLSHPGPSETGIVANSLVGFLDRWIAEIQDGSVYWHAGFRSLEPADDAAIRLEAAGLY